jgi:hypothetical protein
MVCRARSASRAATTHRALRWGGATLGHLGVVDRGELRVELASGVGGLDELAPQRSRAGLGHGLVLAGRSVRSGWLGCQPGEGLERAGMREPPWPAHRGDQQRVQDRARGRRRAGQEPGSTGNSTSIRPTLVSA